MGLFSRFSFADAPHKGPPMSERPPGIYSPILAQMGAPEALQGPTQLPPMQAQATPTMPKKKGLFGGWKTPDENGISKWDRVGLLGASLRDDPSVAPAMMQALQGQSELAMKRQAAQAKSQQQAQLLAMADKLGMNDREKVLFLANPNEWAKANASRFETTTLSKGQQRVGPDGAILAEAPDTQVLGDQLIQSTSQGARSMFTRDPTFAERADVLSAGLPEGFHQSVGPDGLPTGEWTLDPRYAGFAKERAAAGATRVNVPITLPAQNKFAEAFATQYATDLSGAREQAEAAQKALQTMRTVTGVIDNANTGPLASLGQQRDRILGMLGNDTAQSRASNTELLESQLNSMVLPLVKQLGSSNSITNADREFIAKVVGTKDLTPQAIKRIMDIQERDAKAKISRFQQMGQEAYRTVPPAQGLPSSAFGGGVGFQGGGADPLGIR